MSQVALIRCNSYDLEEVRIAVRRGLDLLGGAGRFATQGRKVLLKPNLLVGEAPEKCVNTHHAVFRAVVELFLETGALLSYGDSPAFGSTSFAAKRCGIQDAAHDLNIPEADFKTGIDVFFEKGVQNKKFTVAKAVTDNDVVISLPKLKTHAFEKFTGAVKNQFGCIPGVRKGEYHIKLPDAEQFARMLVDLNGLVNPALYIMDGIMAMEGNGPRGGKPRRMNLLILSADPIALDATVCRLLGLDPEYVPTITAGAAAGYGTHAESGIELLGDDPARFKAPDFDINRAPLAVYRTKGIMRFINNRLVPRPVINGEACIACGVCVTMCPTVPKSVDWPGEERTGPPVHNYKTCIRCYCCQEVCPEAAISLRPPVVRRLIGRL
ncbi:MAG TPA: DUF362 domain-containing protein [Spirochaetota bacterium]|nr:DUF362 domain-containing protein [Spirochaetota bacterium]HOD15357.1 DUF362 domain-containing protein [Spirochaetota bacterium]HPG51393.1 DUF362 domain-containing protein [Spirochaetota bacterium]HPN11776.1 DUF362 domain-containing protein [Spirochaetota bacterium]